MTLGSALAKLAGRCGRYLSRKVYGNTSGFLENVAAFHADRRSKRRSRGEALPATVRREADRLRRDGYWAFENAYDTALLGEISQKYGRLIEHPDHSVTGSFVAVEGRRSLGSRLIKNPVGSIPELRLLVSDHVSSVLSAYYRSGFNIRSVVCWRTYPLLDESQEVYANKWHMDYYAVTSLRLFVALSDVSAATGALRVHSIRSTRELVRAGYVDKTTISPTAAKMIDDSGRYVAMEGPLGTAMAVNVQRCIHRAGVPEPGTHRDIVQFYIEPSSEPLADDWFEALGSPE